VAAFRERYWSDFFGRPAGPNEDSPSIARHSVLCPIGSNLLSHGRPSDRPLLGTRYLMSCSDLTPTFIRA
jgi:hypothetical protein